MNYVLQLTFIKSNFSHSFIAKFYSHNDKLDSIDKVITQPTTVVTKKQGWIQIIAISTKFSHSKRRRPGKRANRRDDTHKDNCSAEKTVK